MTVTVGSLFSGYGGLDRAVTDVLGGETIWTSDIDPGANRILAARYPDVPNLGDVALIDWGTVPRPRVLTGGFPCQDVSMAGRRAGLTAGTRSGLWSMMARAISELHPDLVVIENVRGLLSADGHADVEFCPWCMGDPDDEPVLRALGSVLGDLADLGYDAAWHGLSAASIGAPHARFRVFVIAWPARDAEGVLEEWPGGLGTARDEGQRRGADSRTVRAEPEGSEWERPQLDDMGEARGRTAEPRKRPRDAADAGRSGLERRGPFELEPALAEPSGGRSVAADAPRVDGQRGPGEISGLDRLGATSGEPRGSAEAITDADGAGRETLGGRPRDEGRREPMGGRDAPVQWGRYGPAIERWATVLGRPAPSPTTPSRTGTQRLSPVFVEWMMGLPSGWVTDVPGLGRNEQLKALGNGVVPQQAAQAIRVLLGAVT